MFKFKSVISKRERSLVNEKLSLIKKVKFLAEKILLQVTWAGRFR